MLAQLIDREKYILNTDVFQAVHVTVGDSAINHEDDIVSLSEFWYVSDTIKRVDVPALFFWIVFVDDEVELVSISHTTSLKLTDVGDVEPVERDSFTDVMNLCFPDGSDGFDAYLHFALPRLG